MKKKPLYEVYIEGELHTSTTNKKEAMQIFNEARADGWNTHVVTLKDSIIGLVGVISNY